MQSRHAIIIFFSVCLGILSVACGETFFCVRLPLWCAGIPFGLSIFAFLFLRRAFAPLLYFALAFFSATLLLPPRQVAVEGYGELRGVVLTSVAQNSGDRHIVRISSIVISADNDSSLAQTNVSAVSPAATRQFSDDVRAMVYVNARYPLQPGDVVVVKGKMQPMVAHTQSIIPFEPIQCPVRMKAYGRPEIIGESTTLAISAMRVRQYLVSRIDDTHLSEFSKVLCKTVLLGESSVMSRDSRRLFADAGVSHILAVSGMHVGIIAALMLWLLKPIVLLKGGWRSRFVICAVCVWLYVVLTGMSYSAVRAAVMLTLTAAGYVSGRDRDGFSSLCMATAFILIFSPLSLWNCGLQMSFACVAGLCLLAGRLNFIDRQNHPHTYNLVAILLASLVSTLFTWPLTSYYFGLMPVHFLIANLLLLPLLPVFVVAAAIYFLISAIGHEPQFLTTAIDLFPQWTQTLLAYLYGDAVILEVPAWAVWVWFALMAVTVILMRRRQTHRSFSSLPF